MSGEQYVHAQMALQIQECLTMGWFAFMVLLVAYWQCVKSRSDTVFLSFGRKEGETTPYVQPEHPAQR